jgi:hypothetical protein
LVRWKADHGREYLTLADKISDALSMTVGGVIFSPLSAKDKILTTRRKINLTMSGNHQA